MMYEVLSLSRLKKEKANKQTGQEYHWILYESFLKFFDYQKRKKRNDSFNGEIL